MCIDSDMVLILGEPAGEMWFTDNGRDNMKPDFTDIPPDELNHAPHAGKFDDHHTC